MRQPIQRRRLVRSVRMTVDRLEGRRLLAVDRLDTTFSGDGYASISTYDAPQMLSDSHYLYDTAIGAGGRIFSVGDATGTNGQFAAVTALLSDGTPDTAFGDNGRVIYSPQSGYLPSYSAVAALPDGSVIAAGETNFFAATGALLVSKYLATGQPDTSFGTAGTGHVTVDYVGLADYIHSVAIQPDGKIVAAGRFGNQFGVLRLNADGTLDNSFGTSGRYRLSATSGEAFSVDIAADGKIVVGGWRRTGANSSTDQTIVVRLTTGGTLDNTFFGYQTGAGGVFNITPAAGAYSVIDDVEAQPDGKIVVSARIQTATGSAWVARIDSGGYALDSTFSHNGIHTLGSINTGVRLATRLQSDGSLLYAYNDPVAASKLNVGQLTPYGAPDARFGTNGVMALTNLPGSTFLGSVNAIALQPDGKAVIGTEMRSSTGPYRNFLVRLDAPPATGTATLAGGMLTITGTEDDDSVEIRNNFSTGQIVVTMNGQTVGSFTFNQVQSIQANLLGGDDVVRVRQAVFAPINYQGGNGRDALIIEASNGSDIVDIRSTWIDTESNYATFGNVEDLTVDGMASLDEFDIDMGTTYAGTLRVEGGDYDDVFTVTSLPSSSTPLITLSGGDGLDQFNYPAAGSGAATIEGGPDADTVSIFGRDAAEMATLLDFGVEVGNKTAFVNDIETVDLDLGGGSDTAYLYGIKPNWTVTIDGGIGDDWFNFNVATNMSFHGKSVSLIGGDGQDQLRTAGVNTTTPMTYDLSPTRTTWSFGNAIFDYSTGMEFISVVAGGGADTFNVTPGVDTEYFINGLNPTTLATGDLINVTLDGATGAVNNTSSTEITFANRKKIDYLNVERFQGLSSPPTVTSASYSIVGGQTVKVVFDSEVSASLDMADAQLVNLTTGQVLPAYTFLGTIGGPTEGTWRYNASNVTLPNGNYRFTIPKANVTNAAGQALTSDVVVDFFVLNGDTNQNRAVDFDDLLELAKNYGQSGGKTYANGDFDFDADVDFDDLLVLAKNYNVSLAPLPAATIATTPSTRTRRSTDGIV